MYTFIVVLILVVCALLAIVVLVQNSKGGGLAANFSAPNQIMGVRKTTDFLEKATWTLAIVLVVLSITATALIKTQRPVDNNAMQTEVSVDNNATMPATTASPVSATTPTDQSTSTAEGAAETQAPEIPAGK